MNQAKHTRRSQWRTNAPDTERERRTRRSLGRNGTPAGTEHNHLQCARATEKAGMDQSTRANLTTTCAHVNTSSVRVNEPNALYDLQGVPEMKPRRTANDDETQCGPNASKRTRRPPGRTGMPKMSQGKYPNKPDPNATEDLKGLQQ